MLLIQADLIKALWFVIFPIVTYIRGPVASDSAFCQVSGFFFAVGIESSDVAVLLIAVHSAMYIYRPKSGLYPYRWLAYAAYVIVPLLFASLAFLDGGYENVGYFCYLSNYHGWARFALSWTPRYILFAIIILTYLCIYVYVRHRILDYERRASVAPPRRQSERRLTMPSVTAYRDRIRSLPTSIKPSVGRYKDRLRSLSVGNTFSSRWPEEIPTDGPIVWNLPRFTEASSSMHTADDQDPGSSSTPLPPPRDRPAPTASLPGRSSITKPGSSLSSASGESWNLAIVSEHAPLQPSSTSVTRPYRPSSCATIPTMFPVSRRVLTLTEPSLPSPKTTTSPAYQDGAALTPHISHDPLTSHASRNRDKIRRQLRSLFVYPLLYLVIWTFPLVNQAYGYTSASRPTAGGGGGGGRPPWVLVCSLASLAVQGAADSAVFTAREKPWRHMGEKGFWGSVRRGWRWGGRADGVGRSREEMLVEVRIARARRAKEMVVETGGAKKRGGGMRHWWDFEEGHGDF